jgi:hypothetical protein
MRQRLVSRPERFVPTSESMTEFKVPSVACGETSATSRTDHEVISFAVFLVYRAKRMHAPVNDALSSNAPATPLNVVPFQV